MTGFVAEARRSGNPFLFRLWFFATRVPETRGRTLEEIEEDALDDSAQRDERFERTPDRVKQA